jgi:hypothetical protein
MLNRRFVLALACLAAFAQASAQDRVLGSVATTDATATGVVAVSSGRNLLGESSVVTALDRPARVTLLRGGDLLVCQTSVTHLTGGAPIQQLVGKEPPLLISLDRGALEIRMSISADDAFMTPDLRFVAADARNKPAPLDLAVRVTSNGDTCVENRGRKAPTLQITATFGPSAYLLKPGQHVLFEHGSLTEVVDRETSPCGCPSSQGLSLADAAVRGKGGKSFPFPAAVSEGLAPPTPLPPDKQGTVITQVDSTLTYTPPEPAASTEPPASTQSPGKPLPALTPAGDPAPKPGVFHSIGRFFKRIFAR